MFISTCHRIKYGVRSDLQEYCLTELKSLLVVCYYSRFIELAKLRSLTTEEVITHLKSMFSRHGVCDIFTSDNGGCYSGQAVQKFMKEYV